MWTFLFLKGLSSPFSSSYTILQRDNLGESFSLAPNVLTLKFYNFFVCYYIIYAVYKTVIFTQSYKYITVFVLTVISFIYRYQNNNEWKSILFNDKWTMITLKIF